MTTDAKTVEVRTAETIFRTIVFAYQEEINAVDSGFRPTQFS